MGMGRTDSEPGLDGDGKMAQDPAAPAEDATGQPPPGTIEAAAAAGTAAPPSSVGSALAARLLQNRTKSGKQKTLEGAASDRAVTERPRPSSGSFDLAEPTTVDASAPRGSHPTPGGGSPGLMARTQLGMGEEMRAALAAIRGRSSGAAPATSAATEPQAAQSASGAVEPSTDAGTGPVAEPSGGVVAVSGPIFDLATARVGEGGGAASGPVFDVVSGPLSDSGQGAGTAGAGAGAATPTPTPAAVAGRLAALLAEGRARTGRHATPVVDAATRPAQLTPSPSVPADFVPVPPEASGPVDGASWSADVATVRVPGAAVAQKMGPGFAATLLGLPGPEQEAIQVALAAARRSPTPDDTTVAGRARRVFARDRGAGGWETPEPVAGDATERNLLASGDARAAAVGWGRGPDEQKRITQVVDVIRPAGPSRVKVALVVGAGLMGITAIVIAGVARKANKANRAAAAAAATKPAPSDPARPAALKLAPEDEPVPEMPAAAEAEAPAQAAAIEPEPAEEVARPAEASARPKETKTGRAGAPPVPAVVAGYGAW